MHSQPTVAIVEDDLILAFLFKEVCRAAGWTVVGEASSKAGALDLLSGREPDLLLLDYALDGGDDGIEVLKAVHENWPEVHTSLITGWEPSALAARIDYVEPDSFLQKPLSPATLTEHLQTVAAEFGLRIAA